VTITVHNSSEQLVANATVTGAWSNGASGSSTCTTNAQGQCSVAKSVPKSKSSVVFTVTNVSALGLPYRPTANHDSDGDSTGTRITITAPA
jgi:hypothetical protein